MFALTDTNCRVCLAECLESARDFTDFASVFKNLTKIVHFDDDIPKKVCDSCIDNILNIEEFLNRCDETEQILEQCRKLEDVKLETIYVGHEKPELDVSSHQNMVLGRKNASRMLCCDICGKQVLSSHLKYHRNTHSSDTAKETFICDICKKTCNSKDRIRFHMKQKHLKIIKYQCQYCNRSYQDNISLKFHTSHKHTKVFSHTCSVCDKGFISGSRLANHMAKHSDLRRFNCDICGDSFKSMQYLGCHKREVHSDKELSCTECSKVFKCMKLLRQHQQFHKPHAFKCPLCLHTFSVGQTLRAHLKKNHPELPTAPPGTNLRNLEDVKCYLSRCCIETECS